MYLCLLCVSMSSVYICLLCISMSSVYIIYVFCAYDLCLLCVSMSSVCIYVLCVYLCLLCISMSSVCIYVFVCKQLHAIRNFHFLLTRHIAHEYAGALVFSLILAIYKFSAFNFSHKISPRV